MQWQFLSQSEPQSLGELDEILLANRGVLDPEEFFNPIGLEKVSLEDVQIDLEQMATAKSRILQAIEKKQKILVFGDYDADGICATTILWETLHDLGAEALPFIPDRQKHGYGLTFAAIEELSEHELPALIVTVDTGIVAHEAVAELNKRGVEVIITDHHQPEEQLPKALAVVHTTAVCGSAVSWFVARELNESKATDLLDLVALATVSDLMPLKGVNRSFVYHGLRQLNKTQRVGLRALIEASNFRDKQLDASSIGYALAPRINAMGRLAHGMDALRLLCTSNRQRAKELASIVDETNADRQQLTHDLVQLARQQAQSQKNESLLIAYSPDFHEGVIGLIAGRLAEWYAKPAVVISIKGSTAKGSARSVPGVNITELLRTAREHLTDVGGHPMAAGFGLEANKLDSFIKTLFASARESIDAALLQKSLTVDCSLPAKLVNLETVQHLQKFAPFGQENPEPIFSLQNWQIQDIKRIGGQQQHLKLMLVHEETQARLQALIWGKGELADNLNLNITVNAVGQLQLNQWGNRQSVQLVVRDFQPTESAE